MGSVVTGTIYALVDGVIGGAIITTPILFGLHHRYVRMRCGPLTGAGLMAHMSSGSVRY